LAVVKSPKNVKRKPRWVKNFNTSKRKSHTVFPRHSDAVFSIYNPYLRVNNLRYTNKLQIATYIDEYAPVLEEAGFDIFGDFSDDES